MSKYVQYGCGWVAPSDWLNFDASPTLWFEKIPVLGALYTKNKTRFPKGVEYGNIVKGLPIESSSCDGVYCSHVLEHLSLSCLRAALVNTHKILRPGGLFRLVMPDLENHIEEYCKNKNNDAAIEFMRGTSLGHESKIVELRILLHEILGNSRHLWMWDYKSIHEELKKIGFVNIRRAEFGDSLDHTYSSVEEKIRWDNCLGVECQKDFTGDANVK